MICAKCGDDTDNFYKSNRSYCKTCVNRINRDNYLRNHPETKRQLGRIGKRKCFKCKKIYELTPEFFNRNRSHSYGLSTICKTCNTIENRKSDCKRKSTKERRLKLRFIILERDNFTCQYCGRKPPHVELQIDHIYPKSKGGLNNADNYKTACADCNQGKSDYILMEFIKN